MRAPDYSGGSLVNLVAHLERLHTGASPTPGLAPDLAATIPAEASSTVFVLIDGFGYEMAATLGASNGLGSSLRGRLDASFSTQTSVATATLATGMPPSRHGLLGYLLDLPQAGGVVNTLWWMRTDGTPIDIDLGAFLPAPNLAERLARHDNRIVVIEPAGYLGSPLDWVLYRGARTRGVADDAELVAAVVEESVVPGSLVLAYLPWVDAAGHLEGPGSAAHRDAIGQADSVWRALCLHLPPDVRIVGTADHGMVTATEWVDVEASDDVRLGGDSRVLWIYGPEEPARRLAATLPGAVVEAMKMPHLWGPGPFHPDFEARLPLLLVMAPEGVVFHHAGDPMRMVGYHGGVTAAELEIPLLVR